MMIHEIIQIMVIELGYSRCSWNPSFLKGERWKVSRNKTALNFRSSVQRSLQFRTQELSLYNVYDDDDTLRCSRFNVLSLLQHFSTAQWLTFELKIENIQLKCLVTSGIQQWAQWAAVCGLQQWNNGFAVFCKIKLRMENTVDNKSVDENNKPGVTSLTNHTFYVLWHSGWSVLYYLPQRRRTSATLCNTRLLSNHNQHRQERQDDVC